MINKFKIDLFSVESFGHSLVIRIEHSISS